MSQLIENLQYKLKTSSRSMLHFTWRLLTGLIVGYTLALIGQEMAEYGLISLLFVTLVATLLIVKKTKNLSFVGLLIFNLFCVLLGLVLRMYILIAPGQ